MASKEFYGSNRNLRIFLRPVESEQKIAQDQLGKRLLAQEEHHLYGKMAACGVRIFFLLQRIQKRITLLKAPCHHDIGCLTTVFHVAGAARRISLKYIS